MRLVTDAILSKFPNTLEHEAKDVGVKIMVDNMLALKDIVEKDYNIPITSQHYWAYIARINKTVRPSQYVRTNDFRITESTVLFLYEKKGAISHDDILILMRRFDATNMTLEHVGSALVCVGSKLSQLKEAYLQKLGKCSNNNNIAFTPNDIDCYEIIHSLRVDRIHNMCEEDNNNTYLEIECGDCICFQKSYQSPSFSDVHVLFSNNPLQMATKIYTPQDAFVTLHLRSLFNNKAVSDVTIILDDTTFYLNKCVLSCIPYFKVMLFGGMKEGSQAEVLLQDVSVKGLEALLKYIYKIQDWCPKDDMQTMLDMLLLIDMYGVDDTLKTEVEAIISSKLTPDNVLSVLFAASKITAPRLMDKCTNMIEHNIAAVAKKPRFCHILRRTP